MTWMFVIEVNTGILIIWNLALEIELIEYTLTQARDPVTVRVRGVGGPDFSKPFSNAAFRARFSEIEKPTWVSGTFSSKKKWYGGYFRYKEKALFLYLYDGNKQYERLEEMNEAAMRGLLKTVYNTEGLHSLRIISSYRPL